MAEVTVTKGETTDVGDTALTPSLGTIKGTITDTKGDPLSGAQVSAVPSRSSEKVLGVTNGSGEYSLTVRGGSYTLFVRASGVGYTEKPFASVAGGGTLAMGTTQVAQTVGSISGVVTNDTGTPLAGATVTVVGTYLKVAPAESRLLSAVTNGSGEYTITDVPEGGPYELTVTDSAY